MLDRETYIRKETPLKKDLLKFFKTNDQLTILDIGGCEGEESIRYANLFPKSFIYIFEPLPNNQKLIVNNFSKYEIKNAELIPKAVSNINGIAEFYVSSGSPYNEDKDIDWDFGNKSSSLLEPQKENINAWLKFENKISVETITLSRFFNENKIKEIDFIHMDVQGAELNVLIGSDNFINKIKTIWLEVADVEFYKNQVLRNDIENFMKKKGFFLVKSEMYNNAGDQFYVNKMYFSVITFFFKLFFFKKKWRFF